MDTRMVQFIRALRAAGVRISLAESQDALYGVNAVGVFNRDIFRSVLRATLVKESRDQHTFDHFFPLFFGNNQPPLENIPDNLSPQEQDLLQDALQSLAGDMQALLDLLRQMLEGRPFSQAELDAMGQQAGMNQADDLSQQGWLQRRMNRQSGLQQLQQMIENLLAALEQMGMSQDALGQLRQQMYANVAGLSEQIAHFIGMSLAERMAEREPQDKPELLDVPFDQMRQMGDDQINTLRDEIRRLAAKLRSRAALRQRRAKNGTLDPRKVIRHNMRYGGIPLELRYRTRQVKPRLLLICDVSTSMRYCAEFLLTLIYELHDVVAKTDSFVFIDDMVDISMIFNQKQPREAVEQVLQENPPGYYSTDLGHSLATLERDHYGKLTSKTTVIILGDGRNNHNDPRLDIAEDMGRRARRVLWFCPEPPHQWGTGDSDMHRYAPLADGVYRVTNLRELISAVDAILTD